jgi:hypothetical protein
MMLQDQELQAMLERVADALAAMGAGDPEPYISGRLWGDRTG